MGLEPRSRCRHITDLRSLTRQSSLTTDGTRAWSHKAEHISSTDLWKAFIYWSALESIRIGCSYEIEGRIRVSCYYVMENFGSQNTP